MKITSWNSSMEGWNYCMCFYDALFGIKHASLRKEKKEHASVLSAESDTRPAHILG